MRKNPTFRVTMAALALASLLVAGKANGAEAITWRDLPTIAFEKCIGLTERFGPHPLITTGIHFLAVTAYEERPNEKGDIKERRSYLNVYVVNDLVAIGEPLMILPLDVHLIVNRWVYDPSSATKTKYQWLFLDKDRDGLVDNATFETIIEDGENNVISVQEVDIPTDEIKNIQDYFKTTLHDILQKVRQERGKTCVSS